MASQVDLRVFSAPSNDSTNASGTLRLVNRLIGAGELLKPGQPLDDFTRELMVGLWAETCSEAGDTAFQEAWKQVLKKSVFRPDIAEIRKFLGLLTEPDSEREAKEGLVFIIETMRVHGRTLSPIREREGRPAIPLPEIPVTIVETIRALGAGSVTEGLESLSAHPLLDQQRRLRADYEGADPNFRQKAIKDFETAWVETYLRVRSKGAACGQ